MIIPFTLIVSWLIKTKNLDQENTKIKIKRYMIFYLPWFVLSIFFGILIGYPVLQLVDRFIFATSTLGAPFLFIFMIVDYLIITKFINRLKEKGKKYRVIISAIVSLVIGGILFSLFVGNLFSIISIVIGKLLNPFTESRIGLTVAENKQPYLVDWFGQIGTSVFWIFYIGIVFVGIALSRGIKENKHKIFFSLAWIFFTAGILFSRISSGSTFNGENFISKAFYFISFLVFLIYSLWLYFNKKFYISDKLILTAAWLLPMLIATRGAIRLFFAIVPFVCFMMGYLLLQLFRYARKSKEDVLKYALGVGMVIIIILLIISFVSFSQTISGQAKYTSPSANPQWQNAMSWVRENTPEDSLFVHWWDYGYWGQYLGERPTVTDGGHANTFWDHLIGRYV
jgi:asparagine N-glycosylation enzyme membrane subunit Stt3